MVPDTTYHTIIDKHSCVRNRSHEDLKHSHDHQAPHHVREPLVTPSHPRTLSHLDQQLYITPETTYLNWLSSCSSTPPDSNKTPPMSACAAFNKASTIRSLAKGKEGKEHRLRPEKFFQNNNFNISHPPVKCICRWPWSPSNIQQGSSGTGSRVCCPSEPPSHAPRHHRSTTCTFYKSLSIMHAYIPPPS